MHPIPFHPQERVIAPPEGKHEEMAGLRVVDAVYHDGTPLRISCWTLSDEELALLSETRKLYHLPLGAGHTPVLLTVNQEDCGL